MPVPGSGVPGVRADTETVPDQLTSPGSSDASPPQPRQSTQTFTDTPTTALAYRGRPHIAAIQHLLCRLSHLPPPPHPIQSGRFCKEDKNAIFPSTNTTLMVCLSMKRSTIMARALSTDVMVSTPIDLSLEGVVLGVSLLA